MTELLQSHNAYTFFPVKYPEIYKKYDDAVRSFWTVHEVVLSEDRTHFEKYLNKDEQYFIKMILAFFAASDGIVNENLVTDFCSVVKVPEARAFYTFQMAMETIHSEMYSLMLNSLVSDDNERQFLFDAIYNVPCIKKKSQWAKKWIDDAASHVDSNVNITQESIFLTRLVAFACVEGIFFSGAFCAIFWIRQKGILPGLCKSNEFISRDENMHTEFACLLYKKYTPNDKKLPEKTVLNIVDEAVQTEFEFVKDALPVKLLGMNADDMCEYIKYITNRLLFQLGVKIELFPHAKNPFPFMETISLENKTNFFENTVSEYAIHNPVPLNESAFNTSDGDF